MWGTHFHCFKRACTLVQKSFCYTPGLRIRVRVSVHVQNVRANVKVMEFQSLCIFSCILTFLIILIKPLTIKPHDRRASGDCGTSGCGGSDPRIPVPWFSVWIMKENTMATNFERHECVILFQPMKIDTHENNTIHSILKWDWHSTHDTQTCGMIAKLTLI